MRVIKKVFYLALLLGICWITLVSIVKQFPKGSENRRVGDFLVNSIAGVFGSKPIEDFNSPEQVQNLKSCTDAFAAKIVEPEQCAPLLLCLTEADRFLKERKVAYQRYGVHRLSKVSLGWQMDLLYMSPEDGGGRSTVLEHLICIADGAQVIKLSHPSE